MSTSELFALLAGGFALVVCGIMIGVFVTALAAAASSNSRLEEQAERLAQINEQARGYTGEGS